MARILVVDDEPHFIHLIQRWLAQHGHEVDHAMNGRLALTKLGESDYEIVVTDVSMPEMDGMALLDAIQGRPLPRAVVVLTSRHDYEALSARHPARHIRFLSKPFSPRRLVSLIGELLDAAQTSQGK